MRDARPEPRVADRLWEWAAVSAVLLLAAALRLWGLRQNGYGNLYYAATVRSMLISWGNFWFAAYDPGGFVSVDKPPVAFWVQAAFAKAFGFRGFSVLLPQALAGVATVAVIHRLVWRTFGPGAGILAAFVLAITPLSVAVDRVNNTDSLLVLVLVLAAWPMIRAAEAGRLRLLLLSMALLGVAFNVKMLAAYVVLPAFFGLYLLTAPIAWRTRLLHLAAATAVLVAVSLSWALAVDLTPSAGRPYVGDSQNNTELDLIVRYNGIARLMGGTHWGFGGGLRQPANAPARPFAPPPATGATSSSDAGPGAAGLPPPAGMGPTRGMFGGGPPGPLRFATRGLAGQITWLFPLAVTGMLAVAMSTFRRPLADPRVQALLFWGAWLASGVIVFSFARGLFHPFYVVTMAPALAALVGAGVPALWAGYRGGGWRSALLPAGLVLTAVWQGYVLGEFPDWRRMLLPWLVAGSLMAVSGLILASRARARRREAPRWASGALAIGLVALCVSPTAWAVTPLLRGGLGAVPAAGPDLLAGRARRAGVAGTGMAVQRLVGFLQAHRRGERFLVATVSAMPASPIIIETGEPVMAIGGWGGSDPILTVEQFAQEVAAGQVRYVLIPEPGGDAWGGGRLAESRNADLVRWVREHGRPVDPALWRAESAAADGAEGLVPNSPLPGVAGFQGGPFGGRRAWRGGLGRGVELYDCRPSDSDDPREGTETTDASGPRPFRVPGMERSRPPTAAR